MTKKKTKNVKPTAPTVYELESSIKATNERLDSGFSELEQDLDAVNQENIARNSAIYKDHLSLGNQVVDGFMTLASSRKVSLTIHALSIATSFILLLALAKAGVQ